MTDFHCFVSGLAADALQPTERHRNPAENGPAEKRIL